jgi:hypothetical protein
VIEEEAEESMNDLGLFWSVSDHERSPKPPNF